MAVELAIAYVTLLPEASRFVPEFNRQVAPGLARSGTEQGQKFGAGFTGSLGRVGALVSRAGKDQGQQFGDGFSSMTGKSMISGLTRQTAGLGALGRDQGVRYGTSFSGAINTADASRKVSADLGRGSGAIEKAGKSQGENYGRAFTAEAAALLGATPGIAGELSRRVGPEMEESGREQGYKFSSAFSSEASSGFSALAGAASAAAVNANEANDAREAEAAGRDAPGANDSFGGEIAGFAAGAAAIGFLTQSLADVQGVEKLAAQTAAVIKSTGGAAQVSAGHVADLAESIEAMTSVEMEGTVEGANFLLTFKNIQNAAGDGNDIFDQTVQAMTDMSVAMGSDAKSSAQQLGKALNDPIKGVSALSKVGITFSAEQKKQIGQFVEQNDLLSAQKIILGEVNSQFAGSAEAFGDTTAGGIAKAQNALGNFGEEIAGRVIPAIDTVASALLPLFDGLAGNADTVMFVGGAFLAWKFIPPLLGQLGVGLGAATARVGAFAAATTLAQTAAGRTQANMGRLTASMVVLSNQGGNIGRIGAAFVNASTGASRFATTAGLAAASGKALQIAGGGIMSALGGPFGIAVLAAGAALFFWMKKNQEAKAAAEANEQAISAISETLDAQTGAVTNNTIAAQAKILADNGMVESARNYGIEGGDLVASHLGQADALGKVNGVIDENVQKSVEGSQAWTRWKDVYESYGVSSELVSGALRGNADDIELLNEKMAGYNSNGKAGIPTLDEWRDKLDQAGQGALDLGESVGSTNDQLSEAQKIQKDTALAMDQGGESATVFSEAIDKLSDSASTADDKTSALKQAIDALNGNPLDLEQATSDLNAAFEDTAGAVKPTSEGVTPTVNVDTNTIDVATEAGRKLLDVTVAQRDATLDAARAARDAAVANGDLSGAQQAATAVVEQSRQKFIEQVGAIGIVGVEAERLADKYIGIPSVVSTLIYQPNMAQSQIALDILKGKVDLVPNDKSITVDALDAQAIQKLESLNFKVTTLPNGTVQVDANDAAAQTTLDNLINTPRKMTVTVDTVRTAQAQRDFNANGMQGPVAPIFNANGGVWSYYANGGLREDHTAQIAPAGSWRVFGEPETGGEAYIPLATAKRARSKTILRTVAEKFGMRLDEYADGGITGAMAALVQKRWPGMKLSSGYREGDPGYHGSGMAADFSNGGDAGSPEMLGLANFIADNYMPDTLELIHSPFNRNIKDGQNVGDGVSTYGDEMPKHRDHVHWAMGFAPSEPPPPAAPAVELSAKDQYVDAIVAEGRSRNISDKGIAIALATMLVESDGVMYANDADPESLNFPHEAVGSDTDSSGLFQQRNNGAWGTAADRMDPARSAGMFYEELAKLDFENMDPGAAAQAVQRSAFPGKYGPRMSEAESLLAASAGRAAAATATAEQVAVVAPEVPSDYVPDSTVQDATTPAVSASSLPGGQIAEGMKIAAAGAIDLAKEYAGVLIDGLFETLSIDQYGLLPGGKAIVDKLIPNGDEIASAIGDNLGAAIVGDSSKSTPGANELADMLPERTDEMQGANWESKAATALNALGRGQFTPEFRESFGLEEDHPIVRTLLDLQRKGSTFDPARGLSSLVKDGDFTGGLGVEEDNPLVSGILGTRSLIKDGDFTSNLSALGIQEDNPGVVGALGLRSLLAEGQYTGNLRDAFGVEESDPIVAGTLGARSLLGGEYTGNFRDAFGVEEDNPLITGFLGARSMAVDGNYTPNFRDATGLEESDPIVAGLLGTRSLLGQGDYTPNFGAAFGAQEDNPIVDWLLKMRNQIPVFDNGGTVRPGINLINNLTGADEKLANVTGVEPVDPASVRGGPVDQSVHVTAHGYSPREVVNTANRLTARRSRASMITGGYGR